MTSSPDPASTSKTKLSDIVVVAVVVFRLWSLCSSSLFFVVVVVLGFVLVLSQEGKFMWPTLADAEGDDRKLDSHCKMGKK